ncbi:MAG: helix-turn-helix transcriptional regulator [Clostridiales bacterium]|nr:helix-turn-helix transcriptional regulator [Clostridiales bacterium]
MTLGQKIKAARLMRGMTQREVVGDAITRNMLSKIENDSATPSVRTLEYLAKVLGVPAGYFWDDAQISNGSAPDGLDEARAAFRDGRWGDCLAHLERDKTAGTTDEGYLLRARAGAFAAQGALERGEAAADRELAEAAQYYNQEGMYYSSGLAVDLTLILGRALQQLGEEGWAEQRALFLDAFEKMEASRAGGRGKENGLR